MSWSSESNSSGSLHRSSHCILSALTPAYLQRSSRHRHGLCLSGGPVWGSGYPCHPPDKWSGHLPTRQEHLSPQGPCSEPNTVTLSASKPLQRGREKSNLKSDNVKLSISTHYSTASDNPGIKTKWHLKSVVRYRKSSVLGPVVNNQAIHKPKLAKWSSLCQKGIHLVGSWRIFILCLRRVPTAHFKYEVERYKMN